MARELPTLNLDHRIGAFYLTRLLEPRQEHVRDIRLPKIMAEIYRCSYGTARLPTSLIALLGLDATQWQVTEGGLPRFYAGFEGSERHLQAAGATIEIARKIVPRTEIFLPDTSQYAATIVSFDRQSQSMRKSDDVVYAPISLRIAGTHRESGRVIAVAYDLYRNQELYKVEVSLQSGEMPCFPESTGIFVDDFVISSTMSPYRNAGYVTYEMGKNANHGMRPPFKFVVLRKGIPPVGTEVNDDNGFYLQREKATLVVGYNPVEGTNRINSSSWKIRLPSRLER